MITTVEAMKILRRVPPYVLVAVLFLALGAVVELLIEEITATTAWHDRVVVWILFAQTGALIYLAVRAAALAHELRSQHRAATYIATVEGFWDTLMAGAERDGLSSAARKAIYFAGKEQFNFYYREVGRADRYTLVFNPETQAFDAPPSPEVVLPS